MTKDSRFPIAIAVGVSVFAATAFLALVFSGRLLIAFDGKPIIGTLPKPTGSWFITANGRVLVGEPFPSNEACDATRRRYLEMISTRTRDTKERMGHLPRLYIQEAFSEVQRAQAAENEALSATCTLRSVVE